MAEGIRHLGEDLKLAGVLAVHLDQNACVRVRRIGYLGVGDRVDQLPHGLLIHLAGREHRGLEIGLDDGADGVAPAADVQPAVALRHAPAVADLAVADQAVGIAGLAVGVGDSDDGVAGGRRLTRGGACRDCCAQQHGCSHADGCGSEKCSLDDCHVYASFIEMSSS